MGSFPRGLSAHFLGFRDWRKTCMEQVFHPSGPDKISRNG